LVYFPVSFLLDLISSSFGLLFIFSSSTRHPVKVASDEAVFWDLCGISNGSGSKAMRPSVLEGPGLRSFRSALVKQIESKLQGIKETRPSFSPQPVWLVRNGAFCLLFV
jgi:hypothetical protein